MEHSKYILHSGYYIREQPIFEMDNLVFELQLLLLKAGQRQLIMRCRKLDLGKLCIKLSMLAAQLAKLFTQQGFFLGIHEGKRA